MFAGAPMAKVFQYARLGCTRTIKTRINRFHYIVYVPRNVIIPEAQDAVALGLKPSCALFIAH